MSIWDSDMEIAAWDYVHVVGGRGASFRWNVRGGPNRTKHENIKHFRDLIAKKKTKILTLKNKFKRNMENIFWWVSIYELMPLIRIPTKFSFSGLRLEDVLSFQKAGFTCTAHLVGGRAGVQSSQQSFPSLHNWFQKVWNLSSLTFSEPFGTFLPAIHNTLLWQLHKRPMTEMGKGKFPLEQIWITVNYSDL